MEQIPKIIMEQLEESFDMRIEGMKVSIFSYIGAKKPFVYDENMIMFEVPKKKKIIIEYDRGTDLYNISLYNLRKFEYEKQVKDVYAFMMKDTIFSLLGVN